MKELIILLILLILFFILVMIRDCNRFVKKTYELTSDKLTKDRKWILLSDLHNKRFGKQNEKLYQAIIAENPDGILIAGDMYTSAAGESNLESAEFVCKLAEKYPVYYGNGNHEHKTRLFPETFGTMYDTYFQKLKKAGVHHLVNEKIVVDGNVEIYGLEIDRKYYKKFVKQKLELSYLNETLGKATPEKFQLLIAHNPDYFETYADWGADLTVSGHVHGGLMILPWVGGVISPTMRLFPHFDGGEFQKGDKKMILSRGLGTHTLPIRIFNPGELIIIKLKKK